MKTWWNSFTKHKIQGPTDSFPGAYLLPHPKIKDYHFQVIIGDGMGWDHVSTRLVQGKKFVERCPTWAEMCFIKDYFFDESETVVQFHPAKSEYVNTHKYVLHLWRSQLIEMPTPQTIMV